MHGDRMLDRRANAFLGPSAARGRSRRRGRPRGPWNAPRRARPRSRVERDGARARVTLARPDVRNAFNAELIAELRDAFVALADDPAVRVVVLGGRGQDRSAAART